MSVFEPVDGLGVFVVTAVLVFSVLLLDELDDLLEELLLLSEL